MRSVAIDPIASSDRQTLVGCRWARSRTTAGAGRSGTARSGTPFAPSSRARKGPGRRRSHQRWVLTVQVAALRCMPALGVCWELNSPNTPLRPCTHADLMCCSLCADIHWSALRHLLWHMSVTAGCWIAAPVQGSGPPGGRLVGDQRRAALARRARAGALRQLHHRARRLPAGRPGRLQPEAQRGQWRGQPVRGHLGALLKPRDQWG